MVRRLSFRAKISRVINAPLTFAYDWWTDFREDDPKISGQKRTISILERTPNRFIMAVRYEDHIIEGRPATAARIISLHPPDRWHLDMIGDESNETGDYKLTPLGDHKTRLTATFRVSPKTSSGQSAPRFVKVVNALWDKYVLALEMDYKKQAMKN